MRVVDSVIVVVSAGDGVKVQTDQVWGWATETDLPRMIFVNKMDHERAAFETVLQAFRDRKAKLAPLMIPMVEKEVFQGVVDTVHKKAYIYQEDGSGKFTEGAVPDGMADEVENYRAEIMENVAETDDELLEKYLDAGELTDEEMEKALSICVKEGKVIPVLCGSALTNMGIVHLLETIDQYCSSPLDRPPVMAKDKEGKEVIIEPNPDAPFTGFVFKTIADPYAGRLSLFRVLSGTLQSDSTALNPGKEEKEHFGAISSIQGKKLIPLEKVLAGDFASVAKLKSTTTGDSLCDPKEFVLCESIELPEPNISLAIVPKSKGDEEKISGSLHRLEEEDLSIRVKMEKQTKELLISGMGEVHLEVITSKLKSKFGVEVDLKVPQVPYKETIRGKIKVQGKYKKQTGGRGQYGDCWIEINPTKDGTNFDFVNKIVGGAIPKQYIPAVEKGVVEAMGHGILAGFPVTGIQITLYDGSYHDVDSSEMAFKIAGSMAFKKGCKESRPVLLEPIMDLEVYIPDDAVGDVIGDLNSRRGKVLGMNPMNGVQEIKAMVPMVEIQRYSPDLRSLTGGRGTFTNRFSHYDELPHNLAEKVIAEHKKAEEEEE